MSEPFDDFEPFEEIELTFPGQAPEGQDGASAKPRLDQFIAQSLTDLSRAQVQKLIGADLVLVNGKPEKSSYRLRENDAILVRIPPAEPLDVVAEGIPLNVVFEDKFLVVVNKETGMVTHPGAGVSSGTLVNALLHHCQGSLSGIAGVERPGIVHRLDKDTSGLIVVAKEDSAHKNLVEQLSARSVKRVYLALVEGVVVEDRGKVDKPIARHPSKRKQMSISDKGRHAVTHFQVLERYLNFTLLECKLETGRTHQIRVHMASIGYPVAGDLVYNRKSTGSEKARARLGLTGHALHATQLSFIHPKTKEAVSFNAPLPSDFQSLIDRLRR